MAYTAEIGRQNPSCFVFVVDQSGSMADTIGGDIAKPKAQAVADAINRLIADLTIKCARPDGVRDYYHVAVIGYGGATAAPAFGGVLAGRPLIPLSELANHPARIDVRNKKVDDGAGGLTDQPIRFPIWFDAKADGGTPMCQALGLAQTLVSDWVAQHPDCFPPIVIHITDGESTDGDPTAAMASIRNVQSSDGAVLLFNIHLSSNDANMVVFPESAASLTDRFSRMLFEGASELTSFMRTTAVSQGIAATDGSRSFVLNADLAVLIHALNIGTRPSNMK